MKRIALSALLLLFQGCSDHRYVDPEAMPQSMEPAAEHLRLAKTAVSAKSEGSKVTFTLRNDTDADLCIELYQWVGWTQSGARAFDPAGREYAYRGVLKTVVGDAGPPIRIPRGRTLRHVEDFAASFNVQDWNKVRVTYAPLVENCPEAVD